jgi:sugar lactone lactonase YvrE
VSRSAQRDLQAVCVLPAGAQLGECPVWDPRDARLYWVDIDGQIIHRYDPATGDAERRSTPGRPSALALTETAGRLLVALEGRLGSIDWASGEWRDWIQLEPEGKGNRLNDGRCDPAGRFWVGSMFTPTSARRTSGLLHRVGSDGTAVTVRSGIGVTNGLAFAPDGRTMYFADTRVALPVTKPTRPTFGGRGMSTLFITTIGVRGSDTADPREPEAGGLFAIETDQRGLPEVPFAGRPEGWAA